MPHAIAIREISARYLKRTDEDRKALEAIERDHELRREVKDRRRTEIMDRLQQAFDTARTEAARHVAAARDAYLAHLPGAQQARAAVSDPTKAAAMRELATDAPFAELKRIAHSILEKDDAAGAHGFRSALATRTLPLDPVHHAELEGLVDRVGGSASHRALADFVRSQHVYVELETQGMRAVAAMRGATAPVPIDESGPRGRTIFASDLSGPPALAGLTAGE